MLFDWAGARSAAQAAIASRAPGQSTLRALGRVRRLQASEQALRQTPDEAAQARDGRGAEDESTAARLLRAKRRAGEARGENEPG
jgi:hypothetical protein